MWRDNVLTLGVILLIISILAGLEHITKKARQVRDEGKQATQNLIDWIERKERLVK